MRKLILSVQFKKSIEYYFKFKATKDELLHAKAKIEKIQLTIKQIVNEELTLSKKFNYGKSKNLNYFTVQKHTIFFKVKPKSIHVLYFVASKRVKSSMA